MNKIFYLCFTILLCTLTFGCAGIQPLDLPKEILENPLGTSSLKIGMSKEEVESLWGKPDLIQNIKPDSDKSGSIKEEWIYKAKGYSPVPVDVEYLSKTKHLFFDGNNLIRIEAEK